MENALYVVATPIGNLGDMVPRAVEILQSVQLIAAEDTRHSANLMREFNIDTQLLAYHDHSGKGALDRIATVMESGGAVALISDAGTPLISDPGYRLLQHAHSQGWKVVPVPGASALITALSVAGLATDRFRFEGFLSARAAARQRQLESLATESATMIFYEAPHRLIATLEAMTEAFGEQRLVVLARELTKTFETILRLPVAELLATVRADSNQSRGEIVLLVDGAAPLPVELGAEVERLLVLLADELPPRKAAAIASSYTGANKKELYNWLVARGD
ncbi:16S rRNA (cytidine(1402)-2'-O)-methyltransferase [Halieaceae bacterium IMCC14734]|uniref:Ribosomal RNA small subunit methyltransferase I n=1 Tax=Candidatus Litorirhabdus singularis TaxID=2518993 RepID=A0ABT3TM56_9GAMM|nr:16S rRNA (cytidine(1402)-2'-O)-methyltransferase [Candidatus Litorirhabdus singularis]MCX2982412.1 16S rRNA (cytidine(1402)-2'-O)-methyltransferase [Candidatus Litorirhabdus singularis]